MLLLSVDGIVVGVGVGKTKFLGYKETSLSKGQLIDHMLELVEKLILVAFIVFGGYDTRGEGFYHFQLLYH